MVAIYVIDIVKGWSRGCTLAVPWEEDGGANKEVKSKNSDKEMADVT
jgi:hypothetical protein